MIDHYVDIHNETNNGLFEMNAVEKDLQFSPIGRDVLHYIEDNGMILEMNYDTNIRRNLNITEDEIKNIVNAVRLNYVDLPEGDLYGY